MDQPDDLSEDSGGGGDVVTDVSGEAGVHYPNSEIKVEFLDERDDNAYAEKPRKGKGRQRRAQQKKVSTNAYVQPNSTSLQKTARWGRANMEIANQTVLKKLDEPRQMKPALVREWGETLARKRQIKCPLHGCNKVYGSVTGMKNHYKWCDAEQSEMGAILYPCPVCGSEHPSMNALQNHLWLTHCPPVGQGSSQRDGSRDLSILGTPEIHAENSEQSASSTSLRPQRATRPPERLIDGVPAGTSTPLAATSASGGGGKRAYMQAHGGKRKRLEPIAYGAPPDSQHTFHDDEVVDQEEEIVVVVQEEPEPKRRGRKPGRPRKVTRDTVVLQEDEQSIFVPGSVRAEVHSPEMAAPSPEPEVDLAVPSPEVAMEPKRRGRKPKQTMKRILDSIDLSVREDAVMDDNAMIAQLDSYIVPPSAPAPARRGRKPGPKPKQPVQTANVSENSQRDAGDDGFVKPAEVKRTSRGRIAGSKSRPAELPVFTGDDDDTKCGACLVDCGTNEELKDHIYEEHNGLARPFGHPAEPFTSAEEKLILLNCIKLKKVIKCPNEYCEKSFTSVGGYDYHINICGKEHKRKMVTCEYCGRSLTPMSVKTHMRAFHPTSPSFEQSAMDGSRGKRAAATQALKRVSIMVNNADGDGNTRKSRDGDYDGVGEGDSNEEEMLVEDLFMEPQKLVVTPELLEEWSATLKDAQTLECVNPGCSKTYTSLHSMKTHYLKCPKKAIAREYTCLICNYSTLIRTKMVIHAMKHKRSLKEDNGVQASALKTDSDKLETMFRLSSHAYMYKKRSKLKNPSHGQVQQCIVNGEFDERFFAPHVDFAIQFHSSNSLDDVFESWLPLKSSWKQLSQKEYSRYLPETKISPEFRHHIVTNKCPIPPDDLEWSRLKLFESCKTINKGIYSSSFVGGPVWSCGWCPTPHTQPCRQFLAVYCHQQSDNTFRVEPSFTCPGLIQIWDMGELENDDPASPALCLGIALEFGPIWSMAWCPSGCWQESLKTESRAKDNDRYPRLGLLAAACADGFIRIFSIPHPYSVVERRGCLPIHQVTPVALLCMSPSPHFIPEFQCTSLTWYQGKGHQFVAAGFSNGLIGAWDLTTQSQLLRQEVAGKPDRIFSYLNFRAHGAIVMGLDFSHIHDGRYLVSVSRDRCIKFWDLHDVSLPYNVIRGRPVNGVKWIPHWGGVFIFGDPCYSSLNNSTTYNECGYFGEMNFSLESHNANIWDVSLSYWLNSLVSCDAAGEVVVAAVTHLLKNQSLLKAANRRRLPLYRIDAVSSSARKLEQPVEPVKTDLKPKGGSKKAPKSVETSEEGHIAPTTYQEAVQEYKLQYWDAVSWDLREIPNEELDHITSSERMALSKIDEYPLMSVNRVAWNPNLGSHLWIASGEQSGIVRLICVKSLDKVPVMAARECLLTGASLPMK